MANPSRAGEDKARQGGRNGNVQCRGDRSFFSIARRRLRFIPRCSEKHVSLKQSPGKGFIYASQKTAGLRPAVLLCLGASASCADGNRPRHLSPRTAGDTPRLGRKLVLERPR